MSKTIEMIATRLVGTSTELLGLCATACENVSEVAMGVEFDEENIAEAFRRLEV